MSWQPTMSWDTAYCRAKILADIRHFFSVRNVLEVETPLMCQETVTDLHLEPLITKYDFLFEGAKNYYLQTSPEYAMKRLLAAGYGCIYQICKAFRHEVQGRFHNPEFTILEWYRLDLNADELMDEVNDLLVHVLNTDTAERTSYQHAFIKFVKIDPLNTSVSECLMFLEAKGKNEDWLVQCESLDILLQFIFCEFIEPNIGTIKPCFIYDYPASQASLARLSAKDTRVAERFECYFKGVELVNGFHELSDPSLQYMRFEKENELRVAQGLTVRPIDTRFMAALENGLPNCSGVALGIDRLVMLASESDHINKVISFPVDKA